MKPPTWLQAFPTLQREGFGYIDAGARDGVHDVLHAAAPLLHVIGFEPDAEECRALQAAATGGPWRSLTYLSCGLGARDAEQSLHLCRSRGTSSFYRPNAPWLQRFPEAGRYEVVGAPVVPVRSLDSLRRDPSVRMPPTIDFLKLDIQGAELDALAGAQETVREQAIGLEVEVAFAPLYVGQPLFRDIDTYLAARGFSLFKLRRKSWVRRNCERQPRVSAGQLIAGDALYLRDPLSGSNGVPWSAHRLEALALIATLYDLTDFALEVLESGVAAALGPERQRLARALERRSRSLNGRAWFVLREGLRGVRGLGNLYAWRQRRSWGRADSDKDFYTRVTG